MRLKILILVLTFNLSYSSHILRVSMDSPDEMGEARRVMCTMDLTPFDTYEMYAWVAVPGQTDSFETKLMKHGPIAGLCGTSM